MKHSGSRKAPGGVRYVLGSDILLAILVIMGAALAVIRLAMFVVK